MIVVGTVFIYMRNSSSEKPICLMQLFYFLNYCHHCVKQYALDCEVGKLAGKTSSIFIQVETLEETQDTTKQRRT